MKKFSKKALSAILSILLVLSTASSTAVYADDMSTADTTAPAAEETIQPQAPSPEPQPVKNGWSSDKKYYYVNGKAVTGMKKIGGKKYIFSSNGKVKTGWIKYKKKTYYGSKSSKKYGVLRTGTVKINGKKYCFAKDGSLKYQYNKMDKKASSYSSPTKYLILVSKKSHKVGIYKGKKNNWKRVKYYSCTIGANATPTPSGDFNVGPKNGKPFHQLYFDSGRVRCWYATRVVGGINFHSVLYTQNKKPTTISNGRLGENLSHGCIRLKIENAKWIYDNIPKNTRCIIY